MTQSGWRKPTPELLQAERFAEVGEQLTIPKTRAIVATKKVAAIIGLKSQDLLLLDTFGAVTQSQAAYCVGFKPLPYAADGVFAGHIEASCAQTLRSRGYLDEGQP